MSTTVFKGAIKPGQISATLRPDPGNPDPDLLMMGYAPDDGSPVTRQDSAAPGGFARVELMAPSKGAIEILIATGIETERGHLSVECDGVIEDEDNIQGSTRWIYAVVP